MLIAIDHGNKQMKCTHKTFISGLTGSDTRPPFGEDILKYKGRYYSISEQRIPYMRDKSVDDRFFILTLFAIAYEIQAVGIYTPNEVMDVQLAVGLPPAHYGAQYERFEQYFYKGKDIVDFEFRDKPYSIYISEVLSFPQAYAAAMPIYSRIRGLSKATIIDIGGFTADYLQIRNGQANLSVCDSLENGVILLYSAVKSKVNADYDLLLEESDIDAILCGESVDFDADVLRVVDNQAKAFITDLIGRLRERMIDLRSGKVILVGGGSILLRKYVEDSDKVGHALFVDEINANAIGYELLFKAGKVGR